MSAPAAPPPTLSTGRALEVRAPALPFLPHYHVVSWPRGAPVPSPHEIDEMWSVAHALARRLGRALFGDEECFTVLYNGARTRRRPWPHFHVILARTPREKRRALLALSAKRWLRALVRLLRRAGILRQAAP